METGIKPAATETEELEIISVTAGRRPFRKRLGAVFTLVFTTTVVWTGWLPIDNVAAAVSHLIGPDEIGTESYITTPPEFGEVTQNVTATGSLNAVLNVEVGSQLSGRVEKLLVDFNDTVKAGQPLAVLERASFEAKLRQAEAALAAGKAGLRVAEARIERAKLDVKAAEATLRMAALRLESARIPALIAGREAERKLQLSQRGVGALSDVQDSVSRQQAAAAHVKEAEEALAAQLYAIESSVADLKRAEAERTNAQALLSKVEAEVEGARIDLEHCWIRSPIDGTVIGRIVTQGQTLASTLEAKTLFNIAEDLHRMEVFARIDESDIGKIRPGQDATFSVDAFPGKIFPAKVKQIRKAPQVVQNVVTYVVVLSADSPDNLLLPGMTAVAKITVEKLPDVTKVPSAALRFAPSLQQTQSPKGRSLWVLRDGILPEAVPVEPGDQEGDRIWLKSGDVRASDKIIVGSRSAGVRQRWSWFRLPTQFQ
jgi:HlyD family secretion protein